MRTTGQDRWLLFAVSLSALSILSIAQCFIASTFDNDDTEWYWFGAVLFVSAGTIGAFLGPPIPDSRHKRFLGALTGIALASVFFWLAYFAGKGMVAAANATGEH
jgi:hypothetical protein